MDEQAVGENIRRIRLASNTSLTDVAKRAKITKSTLSKIENGQISSPISTLLSIATALGVRLAEFFQEEGAAPQFVLTRNGDGKKIVRNGSRLGYAYEALAVEFQGKPVEPFLLTVSRGDIERRFRHGGHEFIYILEGDIEFTLGQSKLELHPGDSLYFNPAITHSLRLLSRKPSRFLCLFIDASGHNSSI